MVTNAKSRPAVKVAPVAQVAQDKKSDIESGLDKLRKVLDLIEREPANPKVLEGEFPGYAKAVGLLGGGSVYINRRNADVRGTVKQVQDWVKAGLGAARGPQGQYLRITF